MISFLPHYFTLFYLLTWGRWWANIQFILYSWEMSEHWIRSAEQKVPAFVSFTQFSL